MSEKESIESLKKRVKDLENEAARCKEAESLLRERVERFRGILENTTELIIVLNKDRKYTYISPCVSRLLGYDIDEILGGTPVNLLHSEAIPLLEEAIEKSLEEPGRPVLLKNFKLQTRRRTETFQPSLVPSAKHKILKLRHTPWYRQRSISLRQILGGSFKSALKSLCQKMDLLYMLLWKSKSSFIIIPSLFNHCIKPRPINLFPVDLRQGIVRMVAN